MKTSLIITHRIFDDELMHLSSLSFDAAKKSHFPLEIIFVDNQSHPKYLDWLYGSPDVYIRNNYNAGNTHAWDQGIGASSGDIIILMDNDCVPQVEEWDKEMVTMLSDNKTGITFSYSIVGDELDKLDSGFDIHYRGRRDGFCFAFKKETYDKVGKFMCDQPFKLGYYEDDHFEARVQYNLGLKLVAGPSSKVWHKGQGTTKKMWSQEVEDGIEANKKWYENKWDNKYPYLEH